jgi:cytochrome o ubiquinol oxidase subunit 3
MSRTRWPGQVSQATVLPRPAITAVQATAGDPFAAKPLFGFWIYLMTDCVLFAALFATYAVLHNNTNGGPSGRHLFDMHNVFIETVLLLTSSFTCGLGTLAVQRRDQKQVMLWFGLTFALGVAFLVLELTEFRGLVHSGNSWQRSGFLSGFFTLVGTHGAHITTGLLWMAVLLINVARRGLTPGTVKRLTMLSLFWHLLDIVWIFIFTIVYLLGVA